MEFSEDDNTFFDYVSVENREYTRWITITVCSLRQGFGGNPDDGDDNGSSRCAPLFVHPEVRKED